MNVLITNDDGPSEGLALLREAAARAYPNARRVTLTPKKPLPGTSMSIGLNEDYPSLTKDDIPAAKPKQIPDKTGDECFVLHKRPADLVLIAFHRRDLFLPKGHTWDLVLSGVNRGHNVGLDILHSGTVGQAMIAATLFHCAAIALSQHLGHTDPSRLDDPHPQAFGAAQRDIHQILATFPKNEPGALWNVNFPPADTLKEGATKGVRFVRVAHYSSWRQPPLDLVPRAKDDQSDIPYLHNGYTTISPLQLRLDPALRY